MQLHDPFTGGRRATQFYFCLTHLVMAGLGLMLIPDGVFDAANGSHVVTGE